MWESSSKLKFFPITFSLTKHVTNEEYLTQQLGEYIGAITRLSILALRQSSDITDKEFSETTRKLRSFRHQPEAVKQAAKLFRLKEWGIL